MKQKILSVTRFFSILLSFVYITTYTIISFGKENLKQSVQIKFEPQTCPTILKPILSFKPRCGFLVAPENRTKTNGKTIRLAVTIIPARSKNPAPDPIFYMAGGPGGSARPAAEKLIESGLNANRTLIIMDQRGTTFSKPALLCPGVDNFNTEMVGLAYDKPETGKKLAEANRKCYAQFKKAGVDMDAYNTIENAADFADLRKALGIKKWNAYGVSYGTDLALTYMLKHPEGLRSVIIDSVVPPNLVNLGMFWTNAAVALNTIFEECRAQPQCNATYPNIEQTFINLVKKLEAKPIIGRVKPVLIPGDKPDPNTKPIKVVLDGGAFINWIIGITELLGPDLPEIITQLAQGKTEVVLASYAASGQAHAGDYSYGLHNGVICGEWIPYEKPNNLIKEGRVAFPDFPDSVLLQSPQFPYMFDLCKAWPVAKVSDMPREIKGSIPTLIISGSYDAITSPKFAQTVADSLDKSTHVVFPGIGHFVVPKSKCAQKIMSSFLSNPSQPDISCAKELKTPPFSIKELSASKKLKNTEAEVSHK